MSNTSTLTEVRRAEDDELMGYVRDDRAGWSALTVFGGLLATWETADRAHDEVAANGLAAMAEAWWVEIEGTWQPCLLEEAGPSFVRLRLTDGDLGCGGEPPGAPPTVLLDAPTGDRLRRHPAA